MEQEDAGWSDLTESNGALDFTSDLRERPEPTALDISVSSPSIGANTLVAQHDLSGGINCAQQSPLFSQRDGPVPTSSTATVEDIDGARSEAEKTRKRQRREHEKQRKRAKRAKAKAALYFHLTG